MPSVLYTAPVFVSFIIDGVCRKCMPSVSDEGLSTKYVIFSLAGSMSDSDTFISFNRVCRSMKLASMEIRLLTLIFNHLFSSEHNLKTVSRLTTLFEA